VPENATHSEASKHKYKMIAINMSEGASMPFAAAARSGHPWCAVLGNGRVEFSERNT
jgi:hypothetical protein